MAETAKKLNTAAFLNAVLHTIANMEGAETGNCTSWIIYAPFAYFP